MPVPTPPEETLTSTHLERTQQQQPPLAALSQVLLSKSETQPHSLTHRGSACFYPSKTKDPVGIAELYTQGKATTQQMLSWGVWFTDMHSVQFLYLFNGTRLCSEVTPSETPLGGPPLKRAPAIWDGH